MVYSINIITKLSTWELLQGNNREQVEHSQTPLSPFFCFGPIRRSAILNWCTVRGLQKYIGPLSSIPIGHYPAFFGCRETRNFRGSGMRSIKHRNTNHSLRPCSKTAKLLRLRPGRVHRQQHSKSNENTLRTAHVRHK